MRLLDLVRGGVGFYAEDRVSFLDADIAARRPRAAAPGAAAAWSASKLVAPVGVEAVEIGFEQPRPFFVFGPAFPQQRQQIPDAEFLDPQSGKLAAQHRAAHA